LPLEERLLRSFPRSVSAPRQYGVAHAQAWLSLSSDEFWGARATPVAPPSRRAAVWLAAPGFLMRSVITGTASSVITAVGVASRAAETLWGRSALTGVCSSPSPPCHRPPIAALAVRLACICRLARDARAPAVARRAAVAAGRARPAPALGAGGGGPWWGRARVRRAVRGRPCVSATPPPRPQRQRGRAARLNRNPLRHVVAPRRSQRARRGRPERRHAAPGLAASATSMAAPAGPVPALVTSAAAPAASPAVAAA